MHEPPLLPPRGPRIQKIGFVAPIVIFASAKISKTINMLSNPYIVPEPSPWRWFHMFLTRQLSNSLRPTPMTPKPQSEVFECKNTLFSCIFRGIWTIQACSRGKMKMFKTVPIATVSTETESLQGDCSYRTM